MSEEHLSEGGEQRAATDEPDVLVDSALDVVAHTLCSSRCSFMLVDAASAELRVGKARGLTPDVVSRARAKFGESIAGIVASSRQPLLIRDLDNHPELRRRGVGSCKTSSLVSVPVVVGGKVYGVLNVTDRTDGQLFEERDLATLKLLASHMGLCIEASLLHAEIQRLANTDGLTGAYNHRYFHERLDEELARSNRFQRAVSLLMVDVNEFKGFNDKYGHPAGDVVLQEVAATLRECSRHIDLVCRYGGDEFTVVLPETDSRGALLMVGRVTGAVDNRKFLHPSFEGADRLTLSIGISSYPSLARSKQELIDQADKAMYMAKRGDPPYVHCWQEGVPPAHRGGDGAH